MKSNEKQRRNLLKSLPLLVGGLTSLDALAELIPYIPTARGKAILLRSSWQTVNIGDIAHTPGVLALLEKHLPESEVRLWPSDIGNGVEEMLKRRFPKVSIVSTPEEISKAFKDCAYLLHGSGPSLVGRKELARWREETGKPYGIYGITFPGLSSLDPKAAVTPKPEDLELLNGAHFALFRDSVSLALAKRNGVNRPIMGFCPDGTFAIDLRDDRAALQFMADNGLEEGKFMCVIPRNRFTPWWEVPSKNRELDEGKNARNEAMREHDNAPLREAIIAIVRQTPLKILICPEDETQMKLGKQILLDKLPQDVKEKVVWREHYWLTDEALSTYIRSAGLFGLEMHSPIMCIGNGIPAVVGRFAEQTSKGFMWRDIGLGEWLFDMDDEADVSRYVPTVLAIAQNPKAARRTAAKGRAFVEKKQRETLALLSKKLDTL